MLDALRRIRCMLVKEFLQMLRDPRMRNIIFVVPVVQMVVIAFALTTDVTDIRTGIVDPEDSPSTRDLIQEFTSSGHFRMVRFARSESLVREWLDRGDVRAALVLPEDYARDIRGGRTARVQLIVDGSDSNQAAIVLGYANQIIQRYLRREQADRLAMLHGSAAASAPVALETRAWFNPNMDSRPYYVPGLMAVMLMTVSLLLTSIAIVREKEIGTIEQVMVTPIRRYEFLLGKTVPYVLVGTIILVLMLLVALFVFGIRIQGSFLLLMTLAGIYLAGNVGIALLISVSATTQQQALLTAFLVLMPGVLLSGFMFPIRNMPALVQHATILNPMRWFLEIIRGIVIKGVGLETLWPAALAQALLAAAFLTAAVLRFRKTAS